jgi:hypothetical protein
LFGNICCYFYKILVVRGIYFRKLSFLLYYRPMAMTAIHRHHPIWPIQSMEHVRRGNSHQLVGYIHSPRRESPMSILNLIHLMYGTVSWFIVWEVTRFTLLPRVSMTVWA